MVKLVLISDKTYRDGLNNINDCVCIRDASHQFDKNEINKFNVIEISGTVDSIKAERKAALPEVKQVIQNEKGQWVDVTPELLYSDNPIKIVWQDGTDWKEIKEFPKHSAIYSTGAWRDNISSKVDNNDILTINPSVGVK